MENYYYEKLTKEQRIFYQDLCEGLRHRADKVPAPPGLKRNAFLTAIDAVVVEGYALEPGKKDYGGHAWDLIRCGDTCAYFRTAVQQAVMDHKENSAAVYFKMANKHFTREQVSELVSAQFRSLITGTYTLYSSYNVAQSVFYFRAENAPGSRSQAVKGKKANAHWTSAGRSSSSRRRTPRPAMC